MSAVLERRYRRLLWAYPHDYRRGRGDEILATLLDMSESGRRWPALREAVSLVVGGLVARIRANRERPLRAVWLGGLRVGALILFTMTVATVGAQAGFTLTNMDSEPPVETIAFVLALMAALIALTGAASGRYVIGLAAAIATLVAVEVGGQGVGGPATLFGPDGPYFWPPAVALVAGFALAASRVPGGRGLPWLLAVPPAVVLLPTQFDASLSIQPWAFLAVLVACLLSGAVDARISVGAVGLCVAYAAYLLHAILHWDATSSLRTWLATALTLSALLLATVPLSRLAARRGRRPDSPAR